MNKIKMFFKSISKVPINSTITHPSSENDFRYKLFYNISISKNELIATIVSFFVILSAKGTILFNLTYAIDDYAAAIKNEIGSSAFLLSQGRFGLLILTKILNIFGIRPVGSFLLTGLSSIILSVLFGLLICRIWEIKTIWQRTLVIILFCIHPFSTEYYTFSVQLYSMFIGFIIGIIGLRLINRKLLNIVFGIVLIAFSISFSQLIVNLLLISIFISMILKILDNKDNEIICTLKKAYKSKLFIQFISLLLSIILYYVINKIIITIFNLSLVKRGTFIGSSEVLIRINQLKSLLINAFYTDQSTFFPQATKILILVLILFSLIGLILNFINKFNASKFIYLTSSLIIYFASLVSIIGISIPLKEWWPVPRILLAAGLFLSGTVVILYKCYTIKILKIFFTSVIILIIFSFIGVNNNVFTDQLVINERDAFRANRLLTRLEISPSFSNVTKIAIVGGSWTYPIPTNTAIGDMNISAFGAEWSKLNIIKEVTGESFLPLTAEDYKKIEGYCANNPKPKDIDFVTIIDDIGLLWLR